jgi:hypothetical protein
MPKRKSKLAFGGALAESGVERTYPAFTTICTGGIYVQHNKLILSTYLLPVYLNIYN